MDQGSLTVELTLGERTVDDVRVRSTRPRGVASVLAGRPLEEALAMVPLLFSLCGTAHGIAALDAAEQALGIVPDPAHRRARELLVQMEMVEGHAWSLSLDWPKVAGEPPDTRGLASARRQVARMRAALYPDSDALRLGGGRLDPAPDVLREASELVAKQLGQQVFGAPRLVDDADALLAWAQAGKTAAARLVRAIFDEGLARAASADVPRLPPLDADWFGQRLGREPGFGDRPTFEAEPAETGPFARMEEHALVRQITAAWGPGLAARLAARLAEVDALPTRIAALIDGLRPAPVGSSPTDVADRSGEATGLTATSRGPLAYWLRVERGRLDAIASVAPTEWNFHPEGSVAQNLRKAPAQAAGRRAELLVTALDPCVPCRVTSITARGDRGEEADHA